MSSNPTNWGGDIPIMFEDGAETRLPMNPLAELGLEDPAWGIDPSTVRSALSIILPSGSFDTTVVAIPQPGDEASRLHEAREELTAYYRLMWQTFGAPGVVSVEQPFAFGRNVHPQSYYITGINLCALRDSGIVCPIFTRGPGQWKKVALGEGFGQAKKPYILRWARGLGLAEECPKCGTGSEDKKKECKYDKTPVHDKADSLGIAVDAARLGR